MKPAVIVLSTAVVILVGASSFLFHSALGFRQDSEYWKQVAESRPEVVYRTVEVEKPIVMQRTIKETVYMTQYGCDSELRPFEDVEELEGYVQWYRNEKMVQYGAGRCIDYATDFMSQAIADGFLVSTEVVYQEYEGNLFSDTLHMMNTTVIGGNVWAIDISTGAIKLFGTK